MTPEQIKKEINKYRWEQWLARPFGAFMISLFAGVSDLKNISIDAYIPGFVFQRGSWYFNKEIFQNLGLETERSLLATDRDIFDITRECKMFYKYSKEKILNYVRAGRADGKAFKEIIEILKDVTRYIWLAHGLEEIYMDRLRNGVPKYWKGDVELFIGDICLPNKKTAHAIFEDKLRLAKDLKKVVEEFGWLRVRDGFEKPFSIDELREIQEKVKKGKKKSAKKVKIPKEIKDLVQKVKELVYYRTFRTDVFYELLFLSRPIIEGYGKSLGLKFNEMRNCSTADLIEGKIKTYPEVVTIAQYKDDYAFFEEDVVDGQKETFKEIKGSIAFMGLAKGIVRIVKSVNDLPNIKEGDILVTNMTTPNYLAGMKRAIAFVTDEGGITCHAAIIAREMKKPCIIGTRIATKVLKDGDSVEVDANKGIVKILKRA